MATLKRTDSKTLKQHELPPRSCVACTETDIDLVQPCSACNTDYCVECLEDMFFAATVDNTRMPPRCCTMIQIHTIVAHLQPTQIQEYRAKFEEWITPVKTYCPSRTCSAFISERKVPAAVTKTATPPPTLPTLLKSVITNVIKAPSARFFRSEMDITELSGYTAVVKQPMDLSMIQDRLLAGSYTSTKELTGDVKLILSNAKEFNGPGHPVVYAAEELVNKYFQELSDATDLVVSSAATPVPPPFFPCPKCHVAICTDCKQVEHSESACDTSAADHELAMLATFGYKRCPRCHAGVKKMFGCSHMQCVCGAHWCYWCQKSVDECDGSCDERGAEEDEDDEDDYGSELDEEDLEEREVGSGDLVTEAAQRSLAEGMGFQLQGHNRAHANPDPPANSAPPPTNLPEVSNALVNLDAGGGFRWADGTYDFGEEPDEEAFMQVWSCSHHFKSFTAPPADGINRGDLNRMECNRCFTKVEAKPPLSPLTGTKKRRVGLARPKPEGFARATDIIQALVQTEKEAWECIRCRVLVCVGCRDKYKAGQIEK